LGEPAGNGGFWSLRGFEVGSRVLGMASDWQVRSQSSTR